MIKQGILVSREQGLCYPGCWCVSEEVVCAYVEREGAELMHGITVETEPERRTDRRGKHPAQDDKDTQNCQGEDPVKTTKIDRKCDTGACRRKGIAPFAQMGKNLIEKTKLLLVNAS